ncbi:MAG: sigma-54-dependent Fis family transcriptional regulator [Thermoanaerobaculia bacterium]|nr:MAG: sigma-54-dependent Fis family transcriptional regulator [Thermoanaerobaculia bacterium]
MPPAQRASILIVDDEAAIRESLRMVLEFEGYRIEEAGTGVEALRIVRDRPPDAVLLDIRMPEMDGLDAFRIMRERGYEMPVIFISGHADVASAVEATRRGAFDFLEKPPDSERLRLSVRNAVEAWRLRKDAGRTPAPDAASTSLVGSSPVLQRLRETIALAAPTPATVLVTGESGTGKELVARAIHDLSSRRDGPFVQVNCAAIPEELIESELFGHEKGSFTGAVRKQTGKFVAADGGTIFLDEVGDMSARTQAKVLRVLESGDVEPVGAEKTIRVDVRVVAATNRVLEDEIRDGRFREDLYYRLNVVPIRTAPLRERSEDVPLLVEYFARRFSEGANYKLKSFSSEALALLARQPWKGNVRELRNLVERLLILTPGPVVGVEHVAAATGDPRGAVPGPWSDLRTLKDFKESGERLFVEGRLGEENWDLAKAAEALGTTRAQLSRRMEQLGIRAKEGRGANG